MKNYVLSNYLLRDTRLVTMHTDTGGLITTSIQSDFLRVKCDTLNP